MKTNTKILIAVIIFACSVWGRSTIYLKINQDSLKAFSNVSFLSNGNIINEDSLYCNKLIFENNSKINSDDVYQVSKFKCNDLKVTEFTFIGYQNEFARLLYKPIGTKSEYFGKAKINKIDLLEVYTITDKDLPYSEPVKDIDIREPIIFAAYLTSGIIVGAGLGLTASLKKSSGTSIEGSDQAIGMITGMFFGGIVGAIMYFSFKK